MYRSRKLDQSMFNKTAFNTTIQTENANQVFEREIDNYTRMLQQDKRRFFRLQQNKNDILKQFTNKSKELEGLKGKQFKTETLKKKSELSILERQLNQTINSYNDVLALNKSFKAEIQELRKEKLNQKEALKKITTKIQELQSSISSKEAEITEKKGKFSTNKQQILKLKLENENQARQFREQVGASRINLEASKSGFLLKRKTESEQKNEATDTQPLVKYRLRQLINQNKERIRIIQNYRKTMSTVWKSFQQIKQESGTNDLEEITSAFLKHQQQNQFIYQYINKLNKEIDDLNDDKETLANKIKHQNQLNEMHTNSLGITPQKQQQTEINDKIQKDCALRIAQFQSLLKECDPFVKETRKAFDLDGSDDLNQFNLQFHLSQIEQLINEHFPSEQAHVSLKQEATKYTRSPPLVSEQIKDKQQRLFDVEKLREYAGDYWQKRKTKADIK